MGLSRPHSGPRIHPHDRRRTLLGRLHGQLALQCFPRHSRPRLRPALRAGLPPQPVLKDFHNIEHRDAVLAYDCREPMLDESGNVLTRWDGETFKLHPVTGQPVPDESAQSVQWRYVNPRQAKWPEADFNRLFANRI